MPSIGTLLDSLKPQDGKYYRWVSNASEKLARRKAMGFTFVSPLDPAIKGTLLEAEKDEHGRIVVGDLVLMQTSAARAKELQGELDGKNKRLQGAIEDQYRLAGEEIKRKLGNKHRGFRVVIEKDGEELKE